MPTTKKSDSNNRKGQNNHRGRRWVSQVKTVSTYPPEGVFSKDAETIANVMASKKVSPKGIGSAIRMIQYFINRGGKGLSAAQARTGKGQANSPGQGPKVQITANEIEILKLPSNHSSAGIKNTHGAYFRP